MTSMLLVECKRPGGSISEVEEQALDAAKRCIEADRGGKDPVRLRHDDDRRRLPCLVP